MAISVESIPAIGKRVSSSDFDSFLRELDRRRDLVWRLMLGVREYDAWNADITKQWHDISFSDIEGFYKYKIIPLPKPFDDIVEKKLMGKRVTVTGTRTDTKTKEELTGKLIGIQCSNDDRKSRELTLVIKTDDDPHFNHLFILHNNLKDIEIKEY